MEKSRPENQTFLIGLTSFILGIAIGLVVLGWWLWPVNWTGGSFEVMDPAYQQDYLRAAVDSYSFNADTELALFRYDSLGQNRDVLLQEIYLSPGSQTTEQIESFASAVGSENVLAEGYQPPARELPSTLPFRWLAGQPDWIRLVIAGVLFGLLILLFFLLNMRNRARKARQRAEEPAVKTFDTPPDLGGEPMMSYSKFDEVSSTGPESGELPDWLMEAKEEITQQTETNADVFENLDLSDEDYSELSANALPELQSEMETKTMLESLERYRFPEGESQEQIYTKFTYDLEFIPNIKSEEANLLRAAGITAPLLLLKSGSDPSGRLAISEHTGINSEQLLAWVLLTDLLRIPELTWEDVPILWKIGISGMTELAFQEPESLFSRIQSASVGMDLSYIVPSKDLVGVWIEQANRLPKVIS